MRFELIAMVDMIYNVWVRLKNIQWVVVWHDIYNKNRVFISDPCWVWFKLCLIKATQDYVYQMFYDIGLPVYTQQ